MSTIIEVVMTILEYLRGYGEKNQKEKKKTKKNVIIFVVIIGFIVIGSGIYNYLKSSEKKQQQCQQLFEEAKEEFQNNNFLEAAKIYDKIVKISEDEKNNVMYLKGTCYETYGRKNKNLTYIETAIWMYEKVVERGENKSTYYNNALVNLAKVYLDYYDEIYQERLEKVIKKLEKISKYNADDKKDEVVFCIQKEEILGKYYTQIYNENKKITYLQKAQKHYLKCLDYLNDIFTMDFLHASEKEAIQNSYLQEIARFIWKNEELVEISDDYSTLIKKSVNIYNSILKDIDKDNEIDKYIYCKKNIGRCYLILGIKKSVYFEKAYNVFENLLELSDNGQLDEQLMDIGRFIITTGCYSQDDKNKIFAMYDRILQKTNRSKEIQKYIDINYENMMTCYMVCFREKKLEYWERGYNSINELKKYGDFIDDERKNDVNEFAQFYKKIKEYFSK